MNDQSKLVKDFGQAMEEAPTAKMPMNTTTESMPVETKTRSLMIPALLIAVVLGVGTGYFLFTKGAIPSSFKKTAVVQNETAKSAGEAAAEVGKVYGSPDSSTFKDSAEGVLLAGGVGGEGSHRIVREGGESQTVYLTSSVVDLKLFENHRVLVKGETFKAQRAGWLMDVGQVKVLELNATLPDWAKKALEKAETNGNGN
ncbi:MAG TPA: hypothetical protein VJ246_03165 [Patescibacteria group bacterium]|nr:hypothetical protein [Patescibacteria group bacterium]